MQSVRSRPPAGRQGSRIAHRPGAGERRRPAGIGHPA